jgi:hypothetical protein
MTPVFVVFQQSSLLNETFDSYQKAWEFAERYFREGNGIALIEKVTQ